MHNSFVHEMSIVQNADVLNQNSMATDKASYVQQTQRGRDVHAIPAETRNKMCDDIRDLKKASQRTDYMLSLDHCLYEKSKFVQEYVMNFTPGTNSEGINGNYCTCNLHFNTITGYNNMKNFYDAFIVNKITATFYSTEGTNITPIVCKYIMPPTMDKVYISVIDKATKEVECKGNEKGIMTITDPLCAIKVGGKYNPKLLKGMMSMNVDDVTFDYGILGFYARNTSQRGTLLVEYDVDFYSSVLYNSIESSDLPSDSPCYGKQALLVRNEKEERQRAKIIKKVNK